MREKIRIIIEYLKYFCKAKSKYSVHSPWVYNLLTNVLHEKKHQKYSNNFSEIEILREKLIRINQKASDITLGIKAKTKHNTLGNKIKSISQSANGARILSRMTEFAKPEIILELGTAAGITTMYISQSAPEAKIYTIEGDKMIAKVAQENFKHLNYHNISLLEGNFSEILPILVSDLPTIDLAFLDGDHSKSGTLHYLELIKPKLHANSVVIIHDIYWSEDMKKAWHEIINMPEVIISIDYFYFGILFFNTRTAKQHYILK